MGALGLRKYAEIIAGPEEALRARQAYLDRLAHADDEAGPVSNRRGNADEAADLAALLQCAYPALAPSILARPRDVATIGRALKIARDVRGFRRQALTSIGDLTDAEGVRRGLRRFAARERLRIAARELLPHADVDATARELSDLADVTADIALTEALAWADARYGRPMAAGGKRCPFVVIGMGKLGGRELNAGSDIDLLLFYETDEGETHKDGSPTDCSLHEYFTRVAQRFVSTLDDTTEDGFVWRVDLRLRPEGAKGPLVNALAAAERYYETWGRTWERAALVRARPIAGDIAFGEHLLEALAPFVWRRTVDPRIAEEMMALVARARAESTADTDRDLKIGRGGIREAEFFVQSLQLIWGGREPAVRGTNTLDALRRLRAHGYVTDREGREVGDAYLALRRLEHRIQFATNLQTHSLPTDEALLGRIARSVGFASAEALHEDLAHTRATVAERFASLLPRPQAEQVPAALEAREEAALERLFVALDAGSEAGVQRWLAERLGGASYPDLPRHLLALARRPDALLGAGTRDRFPSLAPVLVEALLDAADPEQATRLMAAFFGRILTPSVYARALAEDPRATRRLAGLFGASAFLGEALVGHPELLDGLLFGRGTPSPETARAAVDEELAVAAKAGADLNDAWTFVGALRRAKARVTMEVGLSDLAGDIGTREATLTLSALADATMEHACRFALVERGLEPGRGLAIVAMGKLGGREIGYGSDLDVFFVYDAPSAGSEGDEPRDDEMGERFVRVAQRVLRLVGMPHDDGPGYELDTRLRPSGNQGLLVVSYDAFVRYQETRAADWERQALVKARFCAGDAALGARVIAAAHVAAYERGAPPPEAMHHLRMRMEKELGREREGRYDLKVGRGGLVDIEFAVQWLQMKHGRDVRVRSTETETALGALEACGYLDAPLAETLREGYRFLRRLEQRLRVLHGTGAQLIEAGAPGLALLARRMGNRDGPRGSASDALLGRYLEVTRDVRAAYRAVLGLPRDA